MQEHLTADVLRSLLIYDPETGEFVWRVNRGRAARIGVRAGYVERRKNGVAYHHIKLFGVKYYTHRLAHLYMLGSWPDDEIDHRDGDGENNRWENLRKATRAQNVQNTRGYSVTGLKGVCRRGSRYRASICIDNKRLFLGAYDTPEAAHAAYAAAAKQHFGEFARTN